MATTLDSALVSTISSDLVSGVAVGNVSFGAATFLAPSPAGGFTFNHTCAVGTRPYLLVFVNSYSGASGIPTGVTYNGVAMTQLGTFTTVNAVSAWGLANPPTGSSLVVAVSGATLAGNSFGSAYSFTNVNAVTPVGTFVGAGATSANPSVTVSSGVGQIIACSGNDFSGATWGSPSGTSRFASGAYGSQTQAGTSPTLTWTLSASDQWSVGAISIKP